jgi:xanthosine phosphorylase
MITMTTAASIIQQRVGDFQPILGIILGSGLGPIADKIERAIIIPYTDLPGFNQCSVAGHQGELYLGWLNGVPVACLKGRAHYYEGNSNQTFQVMIRTLKSLGIENLLITNAAGSLREDVRPGELMLITDHINFQFHNPLVGPNDGDFGPRFIGMEEAYNLEMRQQLLTLAKQLNIKLAEGVYIGVLGPSFETPAEIRAFRLLGADAVGMSTVPEVILANHCGLKVAVVSAITNMGCGMSEEKLTHEGTLKMGQEIAENLSQLLLAYIGTYDKY